MNSIFKSDSQQHEHNSPLEIMFNETPAFILTGCRIVYVSDDFYEVHTIFEVSENTINCHKAGFGGAIYASLDPIYPLQLHHILGDNYVIWDLAASIEYLKPILNHVHARFVITKDQIQIIKVKVKLKNKAVLDFAVQYEDLDGNIYAKAVKTIYIADKEYFDNR